MNRQQRRAAGVSGNRDPARMMRQSDIDQIRQQAALMTALKDLREEVNQ